jgi:signal transduction histidine kinase
VTLLHDISGLKRLERLKDEFISTVSHELRTPLAVIRGYAELPLLTSSPEEWGAQAEVLDLSLRKIIAEVDLMSGLINQMLHIARLEAERQQLKLCETDLVELTKAELGALTMAQADGRVHLDIAEAAGSLPVRLDRSSFRQILDNLISNAVKYSPPESPVTVQLQRAGNEALLSVVDSGMGIPADELPLVFERFYRSENALKTGVPGLGLGLHITSRLVKMMGGRITAESRQGKGSTFLVALPLLNAKLSTAGDPPESA